jgi:hypothetical protein
MKKEISRGFARKNADQTERGKGETTKRSPKSHELSRNKASFFVLRRIFSGSYLFSAACQNLSHETLKASSVFSDPRLSAKMRG